MTHELIGWEPSGTSDKASQACGKTDLSTLAHALEVSYMYYHIAGLKILDMYSILSGAWGGSK